MRLWVSRFVLAVVLAVPQLAVGGQEDLACPDRDLQAQLEEQLDERRDHLSYHCDVRAWLRNPSLEGAFTVEVVVARDGSVASATVTDTTIEDDKLPACYAQRYMRFQFEPCPGAPLMSLEYTHKVNPPPTSELPHPTAAMRLAAPEHGLSEDEVPRTDSQLPEHQHPCRARAAEGDRLFDQFESSEALEVYLDAASLAQDTNDIPTLVYALYKAAWCEYRLGHDGEAHWTMIKAVFALDDLDETMRTNPATDTATMINEAMLFTSPSLPECAQGIFPGRQPTERCVFAVSCLAEINCEHGDYELGREASQFLLTYRPFAPEAPHHLEAVLEPTRGKKVDSAQRLSVLADWVEFYNNASSRNPLDGDEEVVLDEVMRMLADRLDDLEAEHGVEPSQGHEAGAPGNQPGDDK